MPTPTVYWDACVFHALLGEEHNRVEGCKLIEKDAREGMTIIYTSAITFTECVWVSKNKDRLSKEHEAVIHKYFMHKYIRIINCDRAIGEQARLLLWSYPHLKPKDAMHVASAIAMQVDVMHTYDNADLVRLDGLIGSPPLRIQNPPNPGLVAAAPTSPSS